MRAIRNLWRQLPMTAKIGTVLFGFFVLAGVIGPLVAPYAPGYENPSPSLSLQAPSGQYLLGTTQSGQDVLSQLLVGIRLTLELAAIVGIVATALDVMRTEGMDKVTMRRLGLAHRPPELSTASFRKLTPGQGELF